jgi:hypothetical protein
MESYFLKFSKNIYSQCGEDGIIEELFRILNINDGVVVEFGANNGVYLSNTFNLWKDKKFNVVLIERESIHFSSLEKLQSEMDNVECHLCEISTDITNVNSIDNILDRSKFDITDENLALMSIDVDTSDYFIFESLIRHKPKIIIIETNTNFDYTQEYASFHNGCSILSVNILAEQKGYKLVCHTGNAILVREDLFNLIPQNDYSLKNLFCDNDCVVIQQSIK